MAEEKKDSFWDSKNDDFWNRPVISDDWLKSDSDSFWNKSTGEAEAWKSSADESLQPEEQRNNTSQWQSHRNVKSMQDNPYIQHYTPEQIQDILEGKTAKSAKKHIHTKICLCAIGVTVLIVCACAAAAKWRTDTAIKTASEFHGAEEKAGNRIRLTQNDTMILEDTVYTVVTDVDDKFFHEKVKIIAVYAELDCKSDSYDFNSDKNSTLSPYIGYDTERGKEYRTVCNSWDAEEYGLEDVGFSEDYFVYSYVNKGYDSVGYYFFTVPVDVEEIEFYAETYSYKKGVRLVETTYVKNMDIEDNPDLEELLSRKVVR